MPDPIKTTAVKQDAVSSPKVKEQEPKSEDAMMAEIKTTSEVIDREMEAKVRESLAEAKRPVPEPELKPDVADAGVIHPQAEAEKVVTEGGTLTLPIDEATYKRGLHMRVAGAVRDKVVVGIGSLAALAMWVARVIKMAHKHTMKVIFRKEDPNRAD